jgi:ABC-type glutathione transport system ATPase component
MLLKDIKNRLNKEKNKISIRKRTLAGKRINLIVMMIQRDMTLWNMVTSLMIKKNKIIKKIESNKKDKRNNKKIKMNKKMKMKKMVKKKRRRKKVKKNKRKLKLNKKYCLKDPLGVKECTY